MLTLLTEIISGPYRCCGTRMLREEARDRCCDGCLFFYSKEFQRSLEEMRDDLVCCKSGGVSQRAHVGELQRRPLPAVGFAAHNGERGRALHGEGKEDHQGHGSAKRQVVAQRRLQAKGLRCG